MEKEKGHFRYLLIMYIVLLCIVVSLFFLFRKRISRNIEESRIVEHYRLWKEEMTTDEESCSVALYLDDEIVFRKRTVPHKVDTLHSIIEALLLPLDEEGYVSYIPPETTLIGISEETGFFFIELSSGFLKSGNITKAVEQIKRTLTNYYPLESLTIICGSTVIRA